MSAADNLNETVFKTPAALKADGIIYVPAFTVVFVVVELLPKTFMDDINKFHLTISTVDGASIYIVGYVYDEDVSIDKKYFCNESIINAAYEMLIWVAENGYLTSK